MGRLHSICIQAVIAPLALVGLLFVACNGSDGGPVATPPKEKSGPLGLSLESEDGPVLAWEDQENEAGYAIAGTVKYGAPCELVQEIREFEQLDFDEEAPADTVRFVLPKPEDDRLSVALEVVAKVTAVGADGPKPLTDAIAFTADPICD